MIIKKCFVLLYFVLERGLGLNILGVFPVHGYSQYLLGTSLMKELARRGHNVTVIAPYKQDRLPENYFEVYVDGLEDYERDENLFKMDQNDIIQSIQGFYELGLTFTEHTLANKAVQNFLESNRSFDLVICEQFVSEALYGFAWYYDAPLIVFSSIGPSEWISDKSGIPLSPSYVPHVFSKYDSQMIFEERFYNFYIHIFDFIYRYIYVYPKENRLAQKYFPGIPHLDQIMYNVSLFLTNSHAAINDPSPIMANIVEVGGLQISPGELPNDLQIFLDTAKNGVVYFNLGSNLKSKHFSEEYKKTFLRIFAKLQQKVLWKFEDESLSYVPSNVMIKKWLPQQEILAHPNVKAFITHGGLLSTTEAAFFGIPMIAIPIFGDQKMNVAKTVSKGIAIHLPYSTINEVKLTEALEEVLYSPRFRKGAKTLSNILNDQQTKPIDRAIYWIEYVFRHKGAYFLRPASLQLQWYQYFGFDVFCATVFLIFIFQKILLYIKNYIFFHKKEKEA